MQVTPSRTGMGETDTCTRRRGSTGLDRAGARVGRGFFDNEMNGQEGLQIERGMQLERRFLLAMPSPRDAVGDQLGRGGIQRMNGAFEAPSPLGGGMKRASDLPKCSRTAQKRRLGNSASRVRLAYA